MIALRRSRYYARGTSEYNRMFARQVFCRSLKKGLVKMIKVIIILGIIFAFVYWVIIVMKAQII